GFRYVNAHHSRVEGTHAGERERVHRADPGLRGGRLRPRECVDPGAVVGRVEVDQARAPWSVELGESRHLLAGDRMADEYDRPEGERVENRGDIRDEGVEVAGRRCAGRRPEPA